MQFYPGIVLPMAYHNDDTNEQVRLGNEPKITDYDSRPGTFYTIDAVVPFFDHEDSDREYAQLYYGTASTLILMTYKEAKAKIHEHMVKIGVVKPTTDEANSKENTAT